MNECEEDLDICGLGTCSNSDDGTYYECECQDGAMITGSGGNLTCIGKTNMHISFPDISCLHFLRY